MKSLSNNILVATSDNAVYTPFVEICYNELPLYIQPLENINPRN